jgi:hypothetical protein
MFSKIMSSLAGGGGGGLPYDVGEEVMSYRSSSQSHWKMHKGTKRVRRHTVVVCMLMLLRGLLLCALKKHSEG